MGRLPWLLRPKRVRLGLGGLRRWRLRGREGEGWFVLLLVGMVIDIGMVEVEVVGRYHWF